MSLNEDIWANLTAWDFGRKYSHVNPIAMFDVYTVIWST